jgi:hypothetical protein
MGLGRYVVDAVVLEGRSPTELAAGGQQRGFLLLEGVWAVASMVALGQRVVVLRRPSDMAVTPSPPGEANTLPR